MGYSGLIYAAIVAAWAAFLVPRWVRRNEEVERAREADVVRGVRVLQRRPGPRFAPHRTVAADDGAVLHGGEDGLSVGGSSAETVDEHVEHAAGRRRESDPLGAGFADAARRRRRILSVLLLTFVVTFVGSMAGVVPGWMPGLSGLLTGAFLIMARRAAVMQAHRRRIEARHARRAGDVEQDDVDEDGQSAEAGASALPRRLVLPEPAQEAEVADGWEPVPVPLPTYVTKPKAPPVERTIDLSRPGSWTSGRLDPVGSVELPRRDPDERPAAPPQLETDADELPEHRRAVGD